MNGIGGEMVALMMVVWEWWWEGMIGIGGGMVALMMVVYVFLI